MCTLRLGCQLFGVLYFTTKFLYGSKESHINFSEVIRLAMKSFYKTFRRFNIIYSILNSFSGRKGVIKSTKNFKSLDVIHRFPSKIFFQEQTDQFSLFLTYQQAALEGSLLVGSLCRYAYLFTYMYQGSPDVNDEHYYYVSMICDL